MFRPLGGWEYGACAPSETPWWGSEWKLGGAVRSRAMLGVAGAASLVSISFICCATARIMSFIMVVIMGWNMFVITCCIICIFIMGSGVMGVPCGMGAFVGWAGGTMGWSLDWSWRRLVFVSLVFSSSVGVTSLPPAERRGAEEGEEETAEEEDERDGAGPVGSKVRELEPCSRLSVGVPWFCISGSISTMEC